MVPAGARNQPAGRRERAHLQMLPAVLGTAWQGRLSLDERAAPSTAVRAAVPLLSVAVWGSLLGALSVLRGARVGLFPSVGSAPACRKHSASLVNPDAGSGSSHCPPALLLGEGRHLKGAWEGVGRAHTAHCRDPTARPDARVLQVWCHRQRDRPAERLCSNLYPPRLRVHSADPAGPPEGQSCLRCSYYRGLQT